MLPWICSCNLEFKNVFDKVESWMINKIISMCTSNHLRILIGKSPVEVHVHKLCDKSFVNNDQAWDMGKPKSNLFIAAN